MNTTEYVGIDVAKDKLMLLYRLIIVTSTQSILMMQKAMRSFLNGLATI